MAIKEAALIIRLRNMVSGPVENVIRSLDKLDRALSRGLFGGGSKGGATHLDKMDRSLERIERRSRRMSRLVGGAGAGAGGMFLFSGAAQSVFEMNKNINTMLAKTYGPTGEATLKGQTIEMSKFRDELRKLVHDVNRATPLTPGDLYAQAVQLKTAGLTPDAVFATLDEMARYAVASDQDPGEAADSATNIATQFKLPMKTGAQAEESLRRVTDVVTYTADRTNSTALKMQNAFKFVGPLAQKLGLEIEYVAAAFEVMARRGIKAQEAGVAFRAMMVRLIRPTNAAKGILAGMGMDINDYFTGGKPLTVEDLGARVREMLGYPLSDEDAAEIDKILKSDATVGEKKPKIIEQLAKALGSGAEERALLATIVSSAFEGQGQDFDMERMVKDLTEKIDTGELTNQDFLRIFDVRQGARTFPVFDSDEALGRLRDEIVKGSGGYVERAVEIMMGGIVGAVARFRAAWELLIDTVAESGVLKDVVFFLEGIADGMRAVAEYDRELLRFGLWATAAVAAIGPLSWIIGGLATSFAVLATPLGAVVAAFAGLAYFNWSAVKATLKFFEDTLSDSAKTKLENFATSMKEMWEALSGKGTDGGEAEARWAKSMGESLGSLANGVDRLYEALKRIGSLFPDSPGVMGPGNLGQQAGNWIRQKLGLEPSDTVGTLEAIEKLADLVDPVEVSGKATGQGEFEKKLQQIDGYFKRIEELRSRAYAGGQQGGTAQMEIGVLLGKINKIAEELGSLPPEAMTDASLMMSNLAAGIRAGEGPVLDAIRGVVSRVRAEMSKLRAAPAMGHPGIDGPAIAGARAAGGPVMRGSAYLVGERGPELFVPGSNGTIVPNGRGGGATQITNSFNISAVDPMAAANQIARILDAQLQRSRQLSMDGRPVYG